MIGYVSKSIVLGGWSNISDTVKMELVSVTVVGLSHIFTT